VKDIKLDASEHEKSIERNDLKSATLNAHLSISADEKEILLKACVEYRAKIPSYLMSKQSELVMIDKLIQKLT
jgi:hypothetical protein